jgi:hypothetical protein
MFNPIAIMNDKPIAASPAPPAAQPLIDAVGVNAIAALGFKKLRAAYTGDCIQVRKLDDNTTQDIGFDANGDLDTAAIATFCGANTGVISIWYDQSGNGYDFNVSNTPQAGTIATNEPIIYFDEGGGHAVTTDAAGNIAAYSIDPGNASTQGTRFLNSPTMDARYAPTITIFGQINQYNSIGIMHTELDNGYPMGTYNQPINNIGVNQSNGVAIAGMNKNIHSTAGDPFFSTIYYARDEGFNETRWWITSLLDNATFETQATIGSVAFNAATYNNCTIFRYYAGGLYQNCAFSGYIYWDVASGTTFTAQQVFDAFDWAETNLGYTNNAPA